MADAPLQAFAHQPEDFGIGRLFKVMRDGVVVANAASERIVLWNVCAGEIFGYSEQEALNMPLHALVPERFRDLHRAGLAGYQATGTGKLIGSGKAVELAGLRKDGTETPIELTLTPIPGGAADGERFALAIVRDIADRKAAEAAAFIQRETEARRRQALHLNDAIVQGLAVTKLALEGGDSDRAIRSVSATLKKAQEIVSELLDDLDQGDGIHPGDLKNDPNPELG